MGLALARGELDNEKKPPVNRILSKINEKLKNPAFKTENGFK